jgi:hypothetical protein
MAKLKQYLWNFLVSLDQLLNTILIGDPDETISSRCGKAEKDCRFCNWLCRVLDWFDPGHCERVIEYDEGEPVEKSKKAP